MTVNLKVKKLNQNAILPTRANRTDAGYDFYATANVMLPRNSISFTDDITDDDTNTSVQELVIDENTELELLFDDGVHVNDIIRVHTGIAIQLPAGTFGFIHNRGSMGKRGILVFGGIIDEGYSGEIIIQVANVAGDEIEYIKAGDKVAQMIIIPILTPDVEEVNELVSGERGTAGFGSSGI